MKLSSYVGSALLLALLSVPAASYARPTHAVTQSREPVIQSRSPVIQTREASIHHA